MRLRTRLALAFLFLSVLPLTAITLYSYSSSIKAFRRAVEAEESAIASDMGKRMELTTTTLRDRLDRVSVAAETHNWRDPTTTEQLKVQIASTLGDASPLVSKLQFTPTPPPPPPLPPSVPSFGRHRGAGSRMPGGVEGGYAGPRRPAHPAQPAEVAPPPPPELPQPTDLAPPATLSAAAAQALTADAAKLAVDTGKVVLSFIPAQTLPPEAQAALADLQHLTTTVPNAAAGSTSYGAAIEAAAARLEQRMRDAERRYQAQARDAMTRRVEVQQMLERMKEGKALDIPVRQDGRVVGTMNAEISMDRVLHTVLTSRSRESGEIGFAIDVNNRLVVPSRDRATLQSIRLLDQIRASKDRTQTVSDDNWVIVAHRDPSGIVWGIARPIGGTLAEIRRATGRNLGLGVLAILVALVGIFPISSRMTRNLSVLHEGVEQIAKGDLNARVPVRSKDEIGSLASAFNRMAQDLGAHQKLIAERERLRGELELCRQIQTEMLPKQPLRLGFAEIKGVSIPAREVGGDFFNYFLLPAGEVVLLVGDVSGKGVGAALLMANAQATLRARLSLEHDLAALADAIDREIDANTPSAVYLTLFMGILDASHSQLRYVNAGHNPQFVLRAGGGLDRLPSTGLPIAMFAGHGYKEASVPLNEGDILFFYTDGITEVENERGEMFGSERLEELLLEHHQDGVDALLARIEQEVLTFRGEADLFDDATMMVLRLGSASDVPPAVS